MATMGLLVQKNARLGRTSKAVCPSGLRTRKPITPGMAGLFIGHCDASFKGPVTGNQQPVRLAADALRIHVRMGPQA